MKVILQTLAYADIFDYPLTEKEIYQFLITKLPVSVKVSPGGQVASKVPFYFLKGREEIVALREKRERWSSKKMTIARRVAGWLKLIPMIKMVGVTGALAMDNAAQDDDIDLLIVTSHNRLWLTRLLTIFLVELVARRRRPNDQNFKDKICLNMFLAEDCLAVPKKEQDLFTAHEVCQMRPLWNRNRCYQKFLAANLWSKKFLANWKP